MVKETYSAHSIRAASSNKYVELGNSVEIFYFNLSQKHHNIINLLKFTLDEK